MSILKPSPPYDLFEEVNVGRREFIVHEDHASETPFSRKMWIGFGGILLAAALLFVISIFAGGSVGGKMGELPYLSSFSTVFGQDRHSVERSVKDAGAQVTYDPGIKAYRLKEQVVFADCRFDVILSYDEENKLRFVSYTLPPEESAEMMAVHAYQLIENTQDSWGFTYGSILSSHYIKYDFAELEKAFTGTMPWNREITWIVDQDISKLGFQDKDGNCISIRLCVDYSGNDEAVQIRFDLGLDTVEKGDFAYTPGKFPGIRA